MVEQRTEFRDLLKARRAQLGYSLRKMEARSIHPESGTQAKFGWLSKLERGKPAEMPSLEMLKALAIGFELPLNVLKATAMREFLDYDPATDSSVVWSDDLTTRVIVARAGEMSDEDRQQLASIAETFARRRTQSDGKSEE
jgi:transcriptional regulator with XRE-family HTH domain